MKQEISSMAESITSALNTVPKEEIITLISIADSNNGDLALPCHKIAKLIGKKDPSEVAADLESMLMFDETIFDRVQASGAYINFFFNRVNLTRRVLSEIYHQGPMYGASKIGDGQLAVFDYSSPNIGKPLHIGHIRSTIIGDAMIRIYQKCGYKIHGINYLGDAGLHLGMIISEYLQEFDQEKLRTEPEQELFRLYVRFGQKNKAYIKQRSAQTFIDSSDPEALADAAPEDEEDMPDTPMLLEAKNIVRELEHKNPEFTNIMDEIHSASMSAFNRVYNLLGISFDEFSGQRHFTELGKKEVMKALELGIAERDEDGTIIVRKIKEQGMPQKVILRADGTAIYATQDMGAAKYRKDVFDFDKMVYVVAEEQSTYFRQLFSILHLMGYEWAKQCQHLSFGMVNLDGARLKTSEGRVVFLEDVLNQAIAMANTKIEELNPSLENKEEAAKILGIGSIKYMVLSVTPQKNIKFTWEKALNMTANSAPYIQYNYARANTLLFGLCSLTLDAESLKTEPEYELVKKLAQYTFVVEKAAQRMAPNLIADYANGLAQTFSKFYETVRIKGTPEETSRLYLADCTRTVLKDSLGLLGIDVPEKM